jgi:hypothetical protein
MIRTVLVSSGRHTRVQTPVAFPTIRQKVKFESFASGVLPAYWITVVGANLGPHQSNKVSDDPNLSTIC